MEYKFLELLMTKDDKLISEFLDGAYMADWKDYVKEMAFRWKIEHVGRQMNALCDSLFAG